MECVNCGERAEDEDIWEPGWGLLFDCLAVCSRRCGAEYIWKNYDTIKPEAYGLEFPEGEHHAP